MYQKLTLYCKKKIATLLQWLLIWIPLKSNRIMFYTHNRPGIVDNPAYLLRYLLAHYPDEYELYWVSSEPGTCHAPSGVRVVGRRSFLYFYTYIRTKIFVTNDMADEWLVKKPGQIYLSTWHGGGAYKQIGQQACLNDYDFIKNYNRLYKRLDYFVASCKKAQKIFQTAMDLQNTIFLPYGSPRNDIFFKDPSSEAKKVRAFYNLDPKKKILLYAPSFFQDTIDHGSTELLPKEELLSVLEALEKATNDSWICLARHHYFTTMASELFDDRIRNGNQYPEMQDLLCASDLLVTDFSSCIWDMGLLHKPVIVLDDAIARYKQTDRGFFIPPTQWPYLHARSIAEIPAVYEHYQRKSYLTALDDHYAFMGSYETGHACEQLAALLHRLTNRKTTS